MKFASRTLLVALVIASLTACSNFRFPGVHKIHIQQGHIITDEMVQQLQVGQTKRQVRFVLGNSLLPHTFDDDRWDYYYSLHHGDKLLRKHLFTAHFENDALVRWEGDYVRGTTVARGASYDNDRGRADDLDAPVPSNDTPPQVPQAPDRVQ
jgi:outer membrane protein assembly factor BamE